ncbi:MAG: hypothetical protein A2474_04015 [Elusimicrobia bacterium RIFOXYC2_FULL_34_12]|nr:MAG: hypothetical protein A2474_04015 [Elusimicrobia bacterium RIFOXYC2_FULL_34_12]
MKKLLFIYYLLFICSNILAKDNSGLAAEYLLTFYPDARTSAMAGAGTSLLGSVASMYYNPAGIASDYYNEISFFYAPLFYGAKFTYIDYLYPLARGEAIAGAIGVLTIGDIEKTNSLGETLYDFSSQDIVFNFAYAGSLADSTYGGLGIKLLSQNIDDYSARSFSADIGVAFDDEDTQYGISLKNIIPIKFGKDMLPFSLRIGLTQKILDKLSLSGDVAFDNVFAKSISRLFFGAEYNYKIYFLRTGINHKEYSCGFGVQEEKYSLNYAVAFHSLSIQHRFSVALRFGIEPSEAEKRAVKLLEDNKRKIEKEEEQISLERQNLEKDIMVFNSEKEKVEKLLLSDEKLKKEWKKIKSEREQIIFELENTKRKHKISQLLLNAQEYFDKKEYGNSLEYVHKVIKEDPQNGQALQLSRKIAEMTSSTAAKEKYIKAIEFYEQGKYTEAIFKADEALKIEQDYSDAQVLIRLSKAQNYILQKRFQDAKYELVEAVKKNPDDKNIIDILKRVQTIIDVMEGK